MNLFKKIGSRLVVLRELFSYLWIHKLWWMIPVVFFFILLGILIFFTQSPALAPFVYTLF